MAKKTTTTTSSAASLLKAEKVDKKTATTKAATKKEEVEFGGDFSLLVNLSIVKKAVESREDHLKEIYNKEARQIMAQRVKETGKSPESFVAHQENASAGYRLQKRTKGFSQETADLLNSKNIPFETVEQNKQFVINPEIINNQKLLEKLAKAINGLKDFDGISIIQEVVEPKHSYTDATFTALAEKVDVEDMEDILEKIGATYYVNQSLDGIDFGKDNSIVTKALGNLSDAGFLKVPEKKKAWKSE